MQEHGIWRESQANDKPSYRAMSLSYHFYRQHLSKRVFFAVTTFEGLWVVSFQTVLKNCSILGLH